MTSAPPQLNVHRSLLKALKLFDADRFRWLDEAAAMGPLVPLRMGPVKTWVVTDPEVARHDAAPDGGAVKVQHRALLPFGLRGGLTGRFVSVPCNS
jgi:hypothetical protein